MKLPNRAYIPDEMREFEEYITDFMKDRPGSILMYYNTYPNHGAGYTISTEREEECPCCGATKHLMGDFETGRQFFITIVEEEGV